MPSAWSKQLSQLNSVRLLNSGNGDANIGGTLTAVPSGVTASMGSQDLPGDRLILGAADAIALSNNSVGTLYGGLYQYVVTRNNSDATPTRGRAASWDLSANDTLYQVTADEPANNGRYFFAGVFINTLTKGNAWWILSSGKVVVKFRLALTGTGAIGSAAYLAAVNNNNNAVDVGTFDVLGGANIGAGPIAAANFYATIEDLAFRRIGVAEAAPTNNNTSLIDIPLGWQYRW